MITERGMTRDRAESRRIDPKRAVRSAHIYPMPRHTAIMPRHPAFRPILQFLRVSSCAIPAPWRRALLFLLLLSLSNVVLDRFGGQIAINGDAWGALRQIAACEEQSMTPDVVIMGSSRAQAGIAPPVLDGELGERLGRSFVTCDLAVTTSVPMEDYYELRRLLDDGVRPRFIIYATADFAFNTPVTEANVPVRDNVEYLAGLSDLPDLAQTHIADGTGPLLGGASWYLDFIAARLVRFYADRRGFEIALCNLAPNFGPCPDVLPHDATTVSSPDTPLRTYPVDFAQGWYPLPEATARSLENSRWQYTAWLAKYQVAPDALAYLGRLVDLAQSRHIGMILLNTPILPQHLAFFPHPSDYLTYLTALQQFAAAHHVPFYDEGLGYDDDIHDFADTNHLNYWGALAFTGWLGVQVVLPEYQRQVLHR
jgi:hypothetical protein